MSAGPTRARMEVSALKHPGVALHSPTPLLRLQSDDRLVAMTRRGNQAAFEAHTASPHYEGIAVARIRPLLADRTVEFGHVVVSDE